MQNIPKVTLEEVQVDRSRFLDYLLIADESEKVVKDYINDGEMFSIHVENDLAGVVLFTYHAEHVMELKNIAVAQKYRGKGIGKLVINNACQLYQGKGIKKLIVGTANSSIGNITFYQKVGFRMVEIRKDFFKSYPEPIYENGIRALDMVMFERVL
ncbi:GNAT family N-acetyltransferase [Ornithinibacillus halotolerans]|nr:GNAT family N-acetyltransferase [Ornithinibacillus halotolerans]